MGKIKYEMKPGHEIRGFMVRIYPTKEDEAKLTALMDDTRRAWNWLVKQREEVTQARAAYCLKNNLIEPKPQRPNYDGMKPEESKKAKKEHEKACSLWHKKVFDLTNKLPGFEYRSIKELMGHFGAKHDYQLMTKVINWAYDPDGPREGEDRLSIPNAGLLQSLVKNYFTKAEGMRSKKFRRKCDEMPVQTRTSDCFKMGDFGSRGATKLHPERGIKGYYNCQVTINGMKIKGRLPGEAPTGRVLEGVSLSRKVDGWWASIKQEVPIRELPDPIPGSVIGIDVGLDYIAALSDGTRIPNTRGKAFASQIAGWQSIKDKKRETLKELQGEDREKVIEEIRRIERRISTLHLRAKRHLTHVIYNKLVKRLSNVETIKMEKLTSKIGQMGSDQVSMMRTIFRILRERLGYRVRLVNPAYTSQECSKCHHRDKEAWSYAHGRYGCCPKCGYTQDRDVNAAENIAQREVIPIEDEVEKDEDEKKSKKKAPKSEEISLDQAAE